MAQTLFAVIAILAFSYFSLNQHVAQTDLAATATASEMELAATEAAREHMMRVTGLAYDEADVFTSSLRLDTSGLSETLGSDSGETNPGLFDDIDDYNGFVDTLSVSWHGQDITFIATSTVRYVDAEQPLIVSGSPTLAKSVAVTVAEQNDSPQFRPRVAARLVQVATPAWLTMQN